MKRSGMELFLTLLKEKWDSAAAQMVQRFQDTGHPVYKSISALSRGIFFFLKKKKRDTIHFNADASNTELLFRIIHSVIPLSIHGAVSKWCKQFCLTEEERELQRPLARKESVTGVLSSVNSQEVKPLVSSPRLASGNSLQKTFRTSNPSLIPFDLQGVCEDAVFMPRVSAGMSYRTKLDEDDGFGDPSQYAENTYRLPRASPKSSLCSNSWRNNHWTSHWSPNTDFTLQFHHLMKENEHHMCRITLWMSKIWRRRILFGTVKDKHPGNWCSTC